MTKALRSATRAGARVRASIYGAAVRVHCAVYFGVWRDRTGSGRAAALLTQQMEEARVAALGGATDWNAVAEEMRCKLSAQLGVVIEPEYVSSCAADRAMRPAPFTGTPYDPDSEED